MARASDVFQSDSSIRTVIRGGTIVTGEGELRADLVIDDDRIVAMIADANSIDSDIDIDANGLLVLPGMVDGFFPSPWLHDLDAAALAHAVQVQAYAGGFTTIGAESGPAPTDVGVPSHLSLDAAIWLPVSPDSIPTTAQLERMKQVGLVGLSVDLGDKQPFTAAMLQQLMLAVAAQNLPLAVRPIHRELDASDPLGEELVAASLAIMARATGAWLYLHGVTTPGAVRACVEQRHLGAHITISVSGMHLALARESGRGIAPSIPLRSRNLVDELWEYVRTHQVDCVGATSFISQSHEPVSDVQTAFNTFWHEAVHRRGMTPTRVVRLMSTTPARLLGQYPLKGKIGIGSDADLVLFNPDAHRVCSGAETLASPLEGMKITGMVTRVLHRGRTVFDARHHDDDTLVIPGTGVLLHRVAR